MADRLVLVTGGTGKTGSRVARRLRERGIAVRVGARSTGFDWTDETTWGRALAEVDAVYLAPSDGARSRTRAFARRAATAGVRRIVLLSARGATTPGYFEDQEALHDFPDSEAGVVDSGAEWGIVRPGWFMQNFDEGEFLRALRSGRLELPTGDAAAAWIDAEDIAAVAVALLLADGRGGDAVELSGPRAVSLAEAVALISAASGCDIRYVPITADTYRARLRREGLDETEVRVAGAGVSAIRRGSEEPVTDGVRRVLGRDPGSFEDFVRRSADAWR